jgi:hypothetical protein
MLGAFAMLDLAGHPVLFQILCVVVLDGVRALDREERQHGTAGN